jgi:sialic acid synthase SpsE
MHPKFLQELIGKKSKENLKKDHKVKLSDIK